MQSQVVSFRRVLHDRAFQQQHISQSFQNMEHNEAKLRVQLQSEKIMVASMMERFQETSESGRQAVISAQEMAALLQMKYRKQRQP